jgi:hypothetical protein
MSAPAEADPAVPAEGASAPAPGGAAIEAEVSSHKFRPSTLILTPFVGARPMTGMTMIRQLR